MKGLRALLFSLMLAFFIVSCKGEKERLFKRSEVMMDTFVNITVVSDSKQRAEEAMEEAFRELKRLEWLLNFFSEESEVSKINSNSGERPVATTKETFELLTKAVEVSELSQGAFDITLGVINRLYDFVKRLQPSDEQLKRLLPLVGYKNIELYPRNRIVFLKKKGMMIDPGGITKGYAADRAIQVLRSRGIKAALVAVAGDIRGYGLKPDGKPWVVGIRDPRAESSDEIFATMELKDLAVSTSGDYERYFIDKGKRIHHILDPKTGRPARGVISVTVIGPEAVYTDSFATAVFVKGPEEGMKIVEKRGYMALVVDSEGNIKMSSALKGRIKLLKEHIEVKEG
ncbi:MAG: FAD:protein FMN transferase [Nitrospirae bacterium]|nr:MAG: FAD:protein FMN transferase [Nitrospirota bacterium]